MLTGSFRKLLIFAFVLFVLCLIRYNAASGNWVTDKVVVKMDTVPFGNGAMRECFRMKKISSFARPRTISTASTGSGGGRKDSISSGMF